MGIFELAKELGQALKNDKRLVRLEEARVAYENDERVGKLATEYEVQQKAMQNEMMKTPRDETLISLISGRIDALYKEITENEAYRALEAAQNEVNDLMNMVNSTISFQISGEEASGCTHDCSTCGGCH